LTNGRKKTKTKVLGEEDADEMDTLWREMEVELASGEVCDYLPFAFPNLFYFS